MTSQSSATQHPDPEAGSVLCDKCRTPVLQQSDQDTSKFRLREKVGQLLTEWSLSPRMWPVGYLIASSYSPLRLEQEFPKRNWRDAFEDLLALESGGEMISPETREEEKAAAHEIEWQRASTNISRLDKFNKVASSSYALMQEDHRIAEKNKHHNAVSWLDKNMEAFREAAQHRVSLAQAMKERTEARREWSASKRKDRGQWIASLITSGALPGWRSTLTDTADGIKMILYNFDSAAPEDGEDPEAIGVTESELSALFEEGVPLGYDDSAPPLYHVSHRGFRPVNDGVEVLDDDGNIQLPPDPPDCMSYTPERPYFRTQLTRAERITLPNGKLGTKVTVRNCFTNGETEDKVIVQEPGKVLQEVEKARASIHDRMVGFDELD